MLGLISLLPLAFALAPPTAVVAANTHHSKIVDVKATAPGTKLIVNRPLTTTDVTEIVMAQFAAVSNISSFFDGASVISGTYAISTHTAIPENPLDTCFFAIHGIGADHTYWDFKDPSDDINHYSFVEAATARGYPVVTYDRLGVGASAKPDGADVVQSTIQVEIAHQLIQKVRAGDFEGLKCGKVIGIGHSFGSIQTQAVTANYPADLDGAVLTGYSQELAGLPGAFSAWHSTVANEVSPRFKSNKDTTYWAWASAISGHYGFIYTPGVTASAAKEFEAGKQTYTIGEFLTIFNVQTPARTFKGPVTVVTGQQDTIFCSANCFGGKNGASVLPDVAALYPAVTSFSSNVITNTGHGLNFHIAAPKAYAYILDWAKAEGLEVKPIKGRDEL
ncbi:hypothetical protein RQP46_002779 [Phenoliferia psychrophenolica]